ncbi:MAG: CoA transferase [Bacteroidia bacterium]|nr:MAG: CoA transferase [Bacteroidia bacterium]
MFQHLKVIELASVLAGPAAGMFFAELGAKVIKVENPKTKGDVTRHWKLNSEDPNNPCSAYYASVNYNKEIIFEDISSPQGYKNVIDLIKDSDIVICNFKPGDAEKYKFTAKDLHQINPQLIYASITGFGANDSRTAFDVVLQAETGFMSMNGTPETGPIKMPVALIDILAAHQLKEGILIALMQREKNKKGALVEVSLYDAAIASLANQASNWLTAGHIAKPIGSLHPNIAPYGETFKTADNKLIVLAVGNDKQFKDLCNILNIDALVKDERFLINASRVKNRTILKTILEKQILNYNSHDLMLKLNQHQVPAGIIKNIKEVFEGENSKDLILNDNIGSRVKTAIFKIRELND